MNKHFLLSKQKIIILCLAIGIIYALLRIPALLNHTVSYTYDQGRDFLKAEEMVRFHNPTFIGPTTGINGLFHGAWWYYFLAIPYALFGGLPIGFYWWMLLFSTVSLGIFIWFLKKEFGFFAAILFAILGAISPYFISTHISVGNNHVVPQIVLFLIISLYYLLNRKDSRWFFLTGICLAFIFEFEVAFGLFLIPTFLIIFLFFRNIRENFKKINNIFLFGLGLVIPILPRLLFEVKNNFLQTTTIINFFIKPKLHNPRPFETMIQERIQLFWQYFQSLFLQNNILLSITALLVIFTVIIFYLKRAQKNEKNILIFSLLLLAGLFILSLTYKDNFWVNYYEGIQYLMLFIVVLSTAVLIQRNFMRGYIIAIFFLLAVLVGYQKIQEPVDLNGGLSRTEKAIAFIHTDVKDNKYCVRTYTPPVLTYTYDYIFHYNDSKAWAKLPEVEYVNNQCWFIIEDDSYAFRLDAWKKNNIDPKSKVIKAKDFGPELSVELRRL